MISGIGIDLTEIARIRKMLLAPSGDRFMQRVLTADERELANGRSARLAEFVAGRFAAKEAVSKAFGCGIGQTLGFQDMSIIPDAAGRPVCRLSAACLERLGRKDSEVRLHLSITHSETTAAAFAVVERYE